MDVSRETSPTKVVGFRRLKEQRGWTDAEYVDRANELLMDDRTETFDTRAVDDATPFAALAFKIATDPFVGRLTFFRVYSGVLKAGSHVYNSTKDKRERIGRLLRAKERQAK